MNKILFCLLFLPIFLSAQTEPQITPRQFGAFGAAAGDIPTVSATPSLGHTHITRQALATALSPFVEISAIGPLTGDGSAASPLELGQNGATSGQVLKWNGSVWAPATDNVGSVTGQNFTAGSMKVAVTGGTGAVLSAVSVDVNESNLTLNNIGGTLSAAKGGTGVTTLANLTAGSTKVAVTGGTAAVVVATSVDVNEGNLNLANIGGTLPNTKIAQNGATSGQALKWNGTAWAPATDAGITAEAQTVSRNVGTNNVVTLSVTGSTVNVEDLFDVANATFTAGQTTATTTLTLPAENTKIRLTRNGILYEVGTTGCATCNVTRSGTTFTFGSALASGEIVKIIVPKQ